jgi:hypothetical protein
LSEKGVRIFYDAWDQNPAVFTDQHIEKQLRSCAYIGVVVSPNLLLAPNARRELAVAKKLREVSKGRAGTLILLLWQETNDVIPDTDGRCVKIDFRQGLNEEQLGNLVSMVTKKSGRTA